MAKALIVCPATESLELIEYLQSPLGTLIHACSRFRPATSLNCARHCAQKGRCVLGTAELVFEIDDEVDTEIDLDALPAAFAAERNGRQ